MDWGDEIKEGKIVVETVHPANTAMPTPPHDSTELPQINIPN
jgi:hypothetical protein